MLDTQVRTQWEKGEIIRHIKTGHPYLVIHIYKYIATIIIDLEDKSELPLSRTLLAREYKNYTSDRNMDAKKTLNDTIEWNYHPYDFTI